MRIKILYSICTLQVNEHSFMLRKDLILNQVKVALDIRLEQEIKWTLKNSLTMYNESQFHLVIDDQQTVMQIKKTIKNNINNEFQDMSHNHIKTLLVQGRLLDLMNVQESFIAWHSFIYSLPHDVQQFAISASIDTFNSNKH